MFGRFHEAKRRSFRLRVITIGNNLRHLWFGIPPLPDVRGQQSGSMVVHLEAVKEPATHAVRYQDILYSLYQDMLYTSVPEAKRRPFRGHMYPENRFICRRCC